MTLEELLLRATPGPWTLDAFQGTCAAGRGIESRDGPVVSVVCVTCLGDNPRLTDADAALIAHMRNTYAALVEALEDIIESNEWIGLERRERAITALAAAKEVRS